MGITFSLGIDLTFADPSQTDAESTMLAEKILELDDLIGMTSERETQLTKILALSEASLRMEKQWLWNLKSTVDSPEEQKVAENNIKFLERKMPAWKLYQKELQTQKDRLVAMKETIEQYKTEIEAENVVVDFYRMDD